MDYLSIAQTALYYVYLLLYHLFYPLALVLSPAFHLSRYALHTVLVPFHLFAKFETLYIFLGVAAVIGVITGSLLHLSSTIVVSSLNLQSSPEDEYLKPASLLRLRRRLPQQRIKSPAMARSGEMPRGEGANLERAYAGMDRAAGRARGGERGILSQTILEEDDDSEEGF